MEVRMECTKGTVVSGIDPVLAEIQQQLQAHPTEWLKALRANPAAFANLRRRKKSGPHRSETEIAWRRVAPAPGAVAAWVADLCDDDLLSVLRAFA